MSVLDRPPFICTPDGCGCPRYLTVNSTPNHPARPQCGSGHMSSLLDRTPFSEPLVLYPGNREQVEELLARVSQRVETVTRRLESMGEQRNALADAAAELEAARRLLEHVSRALRVGGPWPL